MKISGLILFLMVTGALSIDPPNPDYYVLRHDYGLWAASDAWKNGKGCPQELMKFEAKYYCPTVDGLETGRNPDLVLVAKYKNNRIGTYHVKNYRPLDAIHAVKEEDKLKSFLGEMCSKIFSYEIKMEDKAYFVIRYWNEGNEMCDLYNKERSGNPKYEVTETCGETNARIKIFTGTEPPNSEYFARRVKYVTSRPSDVWRNGMKCTQDLMTFEAQYYCKVIDNLVLDTDPELVLVAKYGNNKIGTYNVINYKPLDKNNADREAEVLKSFLKEMCSKILSYERKIEGNSYVLIKYWYQNKEMCDFYKKSGLGGSVKYERTETCEETSRRIKVYITPLNNEPPKSDYYAVKHDYIHSQPSDAWTNGMGCTQDQMTFEAKYYCHVIEGINLNKDPKLVFVAKYDSKKIGTYFIKNYKPLNDKHEEAKSLELFLREMCSKITWFERTINGAAYLIIQSWNEGKKICCLYKKKQMNGSFKYEGTETCEETNKKGL